MLDLTKPPARVVIGSPVGESVKPVFVLSLLGLYQSAPPEEMELVWVPSEGSNIAENQNAIVDAARERGATHIFLHEVDNAMPAQTLRQLLAHGKDIVGCTYPFKDPDLLAKTLRGDKVTYRYMGHELNDDPVTLSSLIKGEPLRKVKFVPMGCTLISMKAIDAVERHMAEKTNAPEGKIAPVFVHNLSYPLDNKRGVSSTTDSAFCGAARDCGFDVWLDARLSLRVEHHGNAAFGLLPDPAPANDSVAA